nr:hypothetical protein [uncultured Flavobacterium sp.]
MARSVQECNAYIVDNLVTTFATEGVTIDPTLWSKANRMRMMCYSFAIAQSLGEQIQDINLEAMQTVLDKSAAASPLWLQDKAFKFQYSATNPQVLTVVNGVVQYPTENAALRIIKACAVNPTLANHVNIKVAKNAPLEALSSTELTAAQGYFDQIGAAGITYDLISLDPDQLYIKATIYYNSLYSAVIQSSVIDALDNYLLGLSVTRFGGDILLSDIAKVIKEVAGVNDVVFDRVAARYDSQTLLAGIDLVLAGTEQNRKYSMAAGYMIQETTSGSTFADTLTFIAE